MRFLITTKLIFEEEMPSKAAALFVNDLKSDSSDKTLTVGWNSITQAGTQRIVKHLTEPIALYKALYEEKDPFKSIEVHQIEAKDELDAYHQMVLKDHEFSLQSVIWCWQLWSGNPENSNLNQCPSRALLWTVFSQLDKAVQKQLITMDPAVLAAKDAESQKHLSATSTPVLANRAWITPAIAKQLWLIHNDPRDLMITSDYGSAAGSHSACPWKHRGYACITALADVVLKTL